MVGAEDRHLHDARDDGRGHPGRTGAAEVHEVVAGLGQRLDDRRQRRHADLQARVEGDVDLGDGAQPAVDVGVGADDLDLEAGHAALADLVERVGHAVHAADGVGHERDAQRVAFALDELALLAAEEGGRGRVWDGRDAGVEEACRGRAEVAAAGRGGQDAVDRAGELALVRPTGAPEEVGVAEVLVLQQREQVALAEAQVDGLQPGVQQPSRVVGAEVGADRAAAHVSLAHHALDHGQDGARVDRAALAAPQRADGQRHRAVRPLGGAGARPAADARSHGWPTERSCGGGAGAGRPPAGPT